MLTWRGPGDDLVKTSGLTSSLSVAMGYCSQRTRSQARSSPDIGRKVGPNTTTAVLGQYSDLFEMRTACECIRRTSYTRCLLDASSWAEILTGGRWYCRPSHVTVLSARYRIWERMCSTAACARGATTRLAYRVMTWVVLSLV